jgi:hypothetical protein
MSLAPAPLLRMIPAVNGGGAPTSANIGPGALAVNRLSTAGCSACISSGVSRSVLDPSASRPLLGTLRARRNAGSGSGTTLCGGVTNNRLSRRH